MQLNISFKESQEFSLRFEEKESCFPLIFKEISVIHVGESYVGNYDVTPHFYPQTLQTNKKYMNDNVLVYSIPIQKVSNPQGGKTATIG